MIERIHPEIRNFIGNLEPENYRVHMIGQVTGIAFKEPALIILFQEKEDKIECFVRFMKKRFTEQEFLKLLLLKTFW
jgi:hypothetical protein